MRAFARSCSGIRKSRGASPSEKFTSTSSARPTTWRARRRSARCAHIFAPPRLCRLTHYSHSCTFKKRLRLIRSSRPQRKGPSEDEMEPPLGLVDKLLVLAWVGVLIAAANFILGAYMATTVDAGMPIVEDASLQEALYR
jgi:hypothetical protein